MKVFCEFFHANGASRPSPPLATTIIRTSSQNPNLADSTGRLLYAEAASTGYSNLTSLPVSFLYTPEKVSSLYSVELRSLGSRNTCKGQSAP